LSARPVVRAAKAALLLALAVLLAACAGLLGIRRESSEHAFEHRAHAVKGIVCVECHKGMQTAGEEGPLHLPGTDKCLQCHTKPHDSRACASCHGTTHAREENELARRHLRFTHQKHLPAVGGQCVPCHVAAGEVAQSRMRPPMAQCFGCHKHQDQWRVRDCDSCHVDLPAERVRPDSHVVHEGDFVREHGVRAASARDLCATCHQEGFCASCHGVTVPVLPWRLAFDSPRLTGLHRAGFRSRHADEARAAPGLCTTCHASERFCADCHAEKKVASGGSQPGASPHPPNWVRASGGEHGRAARMDPASCASCHGGAGEALCVGCHKVGGPGGNPHGPGFASALDKERDQPCSACHVP
jgi:hypothetical protein